MFIDRNIKYRDILIFALIGVVGYKLIDNYNYFFDILSKGIAILSPFIYAFICAYVLNPIVSALEKNFNVKRGTSIAITYLILVGVIFIILFFPVSRQSTTNLFRSPPYITGCS